MLSRNRQKIVFGLGLSASIISLISLILTCIGVALPSWYRETNANKTIILAEANLFYSCFAPTMTSTTLTCTSYESYQCSTTSYQSTIFNVTSYLSGCINPTNGSSLYLSFDGPIYQIYLDDFYRIRTAAVLSILSTIFILITLIFGILITFIVLHNYLVILAPVVSSLSVILGLCCLITTASVFSYVGPGFALYSVGILLQIIVIPLLSISVGWLKRMKTEDDSNDVEPIHTQRGRSPIIVRRILKRKV